MSGAGITRAGFPYAMEIQTRWADNDVYGHVNNVVYYAYFDSVINRYLIEQGGLDIESGGAIGVCVESRCTYERSISFPDSIHSRARSCPCWLSAATQATVYSLSMAQFALSSQWRRSFLVILRSSAIRPARYIAS